LKKVLIVLSILLYSQINAGYTTHSGTVSGTWSAGTHYISGTVTVDDNTTLTLEAGVIVKFAAATEILCNGTLSAIGTSGANIVFTSMNDNAYGETITGSTGTPAAGDYYGIHLVGSPDFDGIGYFDYCRIRYGGNTASSYDANIYYNTGGWNGSYILHSTCEYSAYNGIWIDDTTPTISGSTFSNNILHGIYATADYNPDAYTYITDNVFNDNGSYRAYLDDIKIYSYSGNTGSGNGTNVFGVRGEVQDSRNWSSCSDTFPISLIENVIINSGKSLTITGGTVKTGAYAITGSGSFYLNEDTTLRIGSSNGITSSGSSGNIRNSGTRSFSSSANYVYNGSSAQVTDNGLPSSVSDLEIDNASGVTLSAATAITRTLYLTYGVLNNSTYNISIGNRKTISRSAGSVATYPNFGSSVNLEYSGSSGVTTGYEVFSSDIIENVTMNIPAALL